MKMRVLIVGERERSHPLAEALETEGIHVERPPESAFGAAPGDQVGELAAALIAFDRLFAGGAPDAVLLVAASNLALAAVLVATKLQIPVAGLEVGAPGEDQASEMNRRLIEQLADGTIACDAGTIVASLRDLVGDRDRPAE
jgi:UDP-N-acetylglucosamine 2-epimerase